MGPEKITFREIRDRLYILEKAYESKSDNLQELSSRLHTIRCILQRTFAAGDPKCTSSTSCVDLAHTVASRLTLSEAGESDARHAELLEIEEMWGNDCRMLQAIETELTHAKVPHICKDKEGNTTPRSTHGRVQWLTQENRRLKKEADGIFKDLTDTERKVVLEFRKMLERRIEEDAEG